MTNEQFHYPPEEVIIKLKKLVKMIEKMQSDTCNEITHAQGRVIFPIIKDEKGYTIQELADIGGVTKGLVSRVVADLEGKGLVERDKKTERQDRNYKIILSEKGQNLVSCKKEQMQEASGKWFGKITHNDINTFIKVLDAFTEN